MSLSDTPRSSGLLLHPTSLPGPYGIGDLGPEAIRWVDMLAAAKQSWWQVLPLGPTGYGDSPYQSYSAFAGNINLISPDLLIQDGLLDAGQLPIATFQGGQVDFARVGPFKWALVRMAWNRFANSQSGLHEEFDRYCVEQQSWLDDYSMFMAAREGFGQIPLSKWPADIRQRDPVALAALEKQLHNEVRIHRFGQFLFDRQWNALRSYAASKGVRIIGDAPIFVAGDSADVWANSDQFLLDDAGEPTAVAGVPPDYFSEDGQLWGNPLYNWKRMADTGYAWWTARLRRLLSQVDLIRLDHFRGFAAAWHVPPKELTARNGRWVDGPRAALFEELQRQLGKLPIIAEDLGVITPDVDALRLQFGLPGMRVIQFALGGPDNPYWPHNYVPDTVAYTGTHDNPTTVGWYTTLDAQARQLLDTYIGKPTVKPEWDLIRLAWSSVAVLAIAPLQDILGLGADTRMNTPGVASGNWCWRVRSEQFQTAQFERLAEWTKLYYRA